MPAAMRKSLWAIACTLLLCGVGHAQDSIYKCTQADGAISYSDEPCAGDERSETVALTPEAAAIAPVQALCADDAQAWIAGAPGASALKGLPASQRGALRHPQARPSSKGKPADATRWRQSADGAVHICYSPAGKSDAIEIVATSDGRLVEFRGGLQTLLNDPRTPIALRERCRDLIQACARDDDNYDRCVIETTTCTGEQPWLSGAACCPLSCKSDYRALRDRDVPGKLALERALGERSCVDAAR